MANGIGTADVDVDDLFFWLNINFKSRFTRSTLTGWVEIGPIISFAIGISWVLSMSSSSEFVISCRVSKSGNVIWKFLKS